MSLVQLPNTKMNLAPLDPFECEVWIGSKKPPLGGKLVRSRLKISRSGVRGQDGVFDVKLTIPTVIEQAERRVAPLLEFCDDEAGANRVNCRSRHENDVAYEHRSPRDEIGDRAVVDGLAQLLRRQTSIKSQGNLGLRSGTQNVPGLGFSVWQPHRTRECIVRMNLDGEWLARKQ